MRIAVSRRIPDVGIEPLHALGDVTIWPDQLPPKPDELIELVSGCDAALTTLNDRIDAAFLDAVPSLRVVSNFAVGYDNIDVAACTARGVAVCITPDVLTETTADFAFALLMSTARRISDSHESIRRGEWKTWEPKGYLGHDVHGATLGIVGMGRIGFATARRAAGFDMRVLYSNRVRNEAAEAKLDLTFVDFETVLAESDFVSVHVPLTADTRHLLDKDAFRRMKSTAVLINTARGPVVDTNALVDAIHEGEIWGAGLDVTDPEPLPADHPLLELETVLVTPHIASATERTRASMATLAAKNLSAVLTGEEPPRCLNPEVLSNG